MDYVEAWFDYHPEPENIELLQFETERKKIIIYWADNVQDTIMIKIISKNARASEVLSRKLKPISHGLFLTQILIGKELFLFTDTRF